MPDSILALRQYRQQITTDQGSSDESRHGEQAELRQSGKLGERHRQVSKGSRHHAQPQGGPDPYR